MFPENYSLKASSDTTICNTRFLKTQVVKVEPSKGGVSSIYLQDPVHGSQSIIRTKDQTREAKEPFPMVRYSPNGTLIAVNLDNVFISTDGKGDVNMSNTTNSSLNITGDGVADVVGSDGKTVTTIQPNIKSKGYTGNNEYYSSWGWPLE